MKTTVEIPEALFVKVKILSARTGRSFRSLLTEALENLVQRKQSERSFDWEQAFGVFRDSKEEGRQIQANVDEEFSRIDPEAWK